ncbi:MAG: PhoH family protein [Nanoarchaeota archaeon]|nr:PhoH family protein [Nanoarchaeota archaeon]
MSEDPTAETGNTRPEDLEQKVKGDKGKVFFLDTNIILDNPDCVYEFLADPRDTVVILDTVLGELDAKKSERGFLGRHSRHFTSMLERRTKGRKVDLGKLYDEGFILWAHEDGKNVKRGKIRFYSPRSKQGDDRDTSKLVKRIAEALKGYSPSLEVKVDLPILRGDKSSPQDDNKSEGQLIITSNIGDLFSRLTAAFDAVRKQRSSLKFTPDLGPKDLEMLRAVQEYITTHPDEFVEFVTNDTNLALTARVNGLPASHRKYETFDLNRIYQGYSIITNPALFAAIMQTGMTKRDSDAAENGYPTAGIDEEWARHLVANQYVVFLGPIEIEELRRLEAKGGRCVDKNCIMRYDAAKKALVPMIYDMSPVLGFKPTNLEQQVMFDLAFNPHVQCITAIGPAGTGKTFVALLLSLYKALKKKKEGHADATVLVTKRFVNVAGEEYGYLPGTSIEKNVENYKGIASNYYQIMKKSDELRKAGFPLTLERELKDAAKAILELLPLGFIRGASLTEDEILIIDEGQNVEPRVMETLLTRVGEGQVWVVGDTYQPDNPLTREDYNGLLQIADMMTRIHVISYSLYQ